MKIVDIYDALREFMSRKPKEDNRAAKVARYHPSKHWIRRNGKAVRATKRYFDGRQKIGKGK